jgi:hypothetical protein
MNGFDDFDLFVSCEEFYDDLEEWEKENATDYDLDEDPFVYNLTPEQEAFIDELFPMV